MVKIIFLVACLILAFGGSSTSTYIECSYKNMYYHVLGTIYQCIVNNSPNILTEESAQISGIGGTHQSSKSIDDVHGFYAHSKAIQVFPEGLEKIFKNIKLIWIYNCHLKEIYQSDLKVFPDLVYLYLISNGIEVIEEGLLDFNPKLEFVALDDSKIIHIDPNVFDHLPKLSYFWVGSVPCAAQNIFNSIKQVQQAIKVVKSNCSNPDVLSLKTQIKTLETESKTLNSADFYTKLEVFEKSFNASKFFKFRPLNFKFQNLKSLASSTQVQNISISRNDLKNVTGKLEDLESSQCDLKCPVGSHNISHNALQIILNEIKSSVSSHDSNSAKFLVCQSNLTLSQVTMTDSIGKISSEVNKQSVSLGEVHDMQKSLNVLINDVKADQAALKASYDQVLRTLKDLKTDIDTKMTDLKTDIKSDMDTKIDEKLEFFEDGLINSEARNGRKIDEVKKELEQVRYKLSVSVDAKLKAVENRMTVKIDKILKALKIED